METEARFNPLGYEFSRTVIPLGYEFSMTVNHTLYLTLPNLITISFLCYMKAGFSAFRIPKGHMARHSCSQSLGDAQTLSPLERL